MVMGSWRINPAVVGARKGGSNRLVAVVLGQSLASAASLQAVVCLDRGWREGNGGVARGSGGSSEGSARNS